MTDETIMYLQAPDFVIHVRWKDNKYVSYICERYKMSLRLHQCRNIQYTAQASGGLGGMECCITQNDYVSDCVLL